MTCCLVAYLLASVMVALWIGRAAGLGEGEGETVNRRKLELAALNGAQVWAVDMNPRAQPLLDAVNRYAKEKS